VSVSDDLAPPLPPNRVFYSLGRMLGVEDFQADQDYHRGRLARALLQVCGTGTVCGLSVQLSQSWQPESTYPAWTFVIDPAGDVEVNTGNGGISGTTTPAWPAAGKSVTDGTVTWTNEGPISTNGWAPATVYSAPTVIADPFGNVQVLTASAPFTSGPVMPAWSGIVGQTTADGGVPAAWTCAGVRDLEVQVTGGIAIDRVGRIIEVPRPVCIQLPAWLAAQTPSALNEALHAGAIVVDVFATFVPCSRGVTPCFATQDDYSATDAFSANRMLDSFAMQLVLRSDASPQLPTDPWFAAGAITSPPSPTPKALQTLLLQATAGPAACAPFGPGSAGQEYPPNFDTSSVFLARISIPATASQTAGQPPAYDLTKIAPIDNYSRLFLYPASLVARWIGLSSGAQT